MHIEIHDDAVFVELDTVTSGLDMLDQILRAFKPQVYLSGAPFWKRFSWEIEQLTTWGFKVLLCCGHAYVDYPFLYDEEDDSDLDPLWQSTKFI